MTIAKLSILLAATAAVAAVPLVRRSAAWTWPERLAAMLTPALLLLCFGESAIRVFLANRWIWNEVRLARTFGLYRGVPLYPGKDVTGPVLGTLHTPLSHILYWPATLAPGVLTAVRSGELLSIALVFFALLIIFLLGAPPALSRLRRLVNVGFTLAVLWLGILRSTLSSCIFIIHGDPIAVACSTLAGGLLYPRSPSPRRLWAAALFAVLAVSAKQTFLSVPPALCLFLLFAEGWRPLRTFCLGLFTWSLLLGSAFLAAFRPASSIVFNVIILSTHRPRHPALIGLPKTPHGVLLELRNLHQSLQSGTANLDFLPGLTFLVLLAFLSLLAVWIFALRHSDQDAWPLDIRQLFSRHRWLVFVTIAAGMIPILLKATITEGAGQNHLAAADYFLALAIAMSYLGLHCPGPPRQPPLLPHLILFGLLAALIPFTVSDLKPVLTTNSVRAYQHIMISHGDLTAEAAAFSLAHPGVAYFPFNPLSSVFPAHRFYSFDFSIRDREIAGYPLTPAQFLTGLPVDAQLIAVDLHLCPLSQSLQQRLSSGWTPEENPELPDFTVFRRNAPISRAQLSRSRISPKSRP